MGWKIINWNPFGEEKKPEVEPQTSSAGPTTVGIAEHGESYSPFQAFGQTAESPDVALRKPVERPRGAAAFADPQQYAEFAKGIPGGAVSFVGTGMQGAAAVPAVGQANAFKFGRQQEALWDRIDRGERIPDMEDAAGYQHMDAEQRRALRADSTKAREAFQPIILADQPLYKAGESVKTFAKGILPAAPGYEDAIGRQLGDGFGSLVAGLPFGIAGRIPGAIFFGSAGAGEAATRAIAYDQKERAAGRPGLTQDQINTSALYGIAPGTTDLLPVEMLLGRLRVPEALRRPLASVVGRIGGQAVIEGVQEGGQAALQNLIAREMYNPEQTIADGVAGEAGIGAGVGGIAQGMREAGGLALSGLSGRRAGTAAPGAPSSDPFAQPLMRQPDAAGSFSPSTIDVDFTDLIPADRRITEEPASPAGMEPPPSAPLALPRGQQLSPRAEPASPEVSPDARDPSAPGTTPVLPVEQRDVYGTTQDSVRSVTESAPMAAPEMQPQRGDFSTGDIMAALGAPQAPAPERDNLGFYSKALESAKALKQNVGTPEQMLAQLRSAGVKESEIKATGLEQFLASKTQPGQNTLPKVTKQEIVDFLDKNRVGLQESVYGGLDLDNLPENLREELVEKEIESTFGEWEFTKGEDGMWRANLYGEEEDGPGYTTRSRAEEAKRKEIEYDANYASSMSDRELAERHLSPEQIEASKGLKGEASWSEYSLDPNNPTYRENVISLGVRQPAREAWLEAEKALNAKYWKSHRQHWSIRATPEEREEMGRLATLADAEDKRLAANEFKSGHWSEPNVVAHTRTQILNDTKGRKVFNIDELQSDWGQALREDSRDEAKIADLKTRLEAAKEKMANDSMLKELNADVENLALTALGGSYYHPSQRDHALYLIASSETAQRHYRAQAKDLREAIATTEGMYRPEIDRLTAELRQEEAKGKTPSHPLVNTTDQWVTTAMRRLIQQAVDSGADGISITPGKVQNERYSIGNRIGWIEVENQPTARHADHRRVAFHGPGSGVLVGELSIRSSGEIVSGRGIFANEQVKAGMSLSDVVGVNLARSIIAAEDGAEISGEDLEIGGEGMRATYDNIYPRTLGKLLQKLDPSIKPEKTRLFPSDYTPRAGSDHSLYYEYAKGTPFENEFTFFPLTEKAKQKIEDEGQPLFALGAGNGRNKRAGDGKRRSESGSLAPLKGAPTVAGATGPDAKIVAAAEQYAKSIGIDLKRQAVFAEVNEELAGRIAQAYEEMAHNPRDPQVAAAYADMIQQTIAQYRALEDAGYQFFFYDEATDPYQGNPWNSIRDLRTNQRMGVFATEAGFGSGVTDLNTDDSPMLADTGIQWPYGSMQGPKKRVLANDLFRAVHDAFGHSMEGAGFRARGEENAWQAHIRLYKGLAVGAVTSETRGQNSWLNFGPYGEANRTASVEDTVFADQKIGLMPEFTWQEGRAPDEKGDLFALGATDQTETAAFKRWFKESKVVGWGSDPLPVYHATLNDFDAFSRGRANPESDMGAGFYFTDSQEDSANNYAHEGGPDIRNRIEYVAGRLLGDEDLLAQIDEANKGLTPHDEGWVNEGDRAREVAKAQLGMAHEGVTMPVYLSIQNPVVLGEPNRYGGPGETFFDYDSGEVFNEEADDYEYGEPSGKLAEFFVALREAGEEFDADPSAMDEVISGLVDEAMDNGGISANRAITGVKTDQRLIDTYDYEGRQASSEIVRRALEKMGFDGIIDHTVSQKWGQEGRPWGGMKGVYPDTTHYIAFKPNQIKSAIGNRGTFDPNDERIAYALKGFYSPAIRATEKLKQEKATPDQWWSMITKSPGIRMEELQWMGLKEWLDEQTKPEYGNEVENAYVKGQRLEEVFPNVRERIVARNFLRKGGPVPQDARKLMEFEYLVGDGDIMPAAAQPVYDWLDTLQTGDIEMRMERPLIREARKTIPKTDLLHFMAMHEMDLEDRIYGGAGGKDSGVSEEEIRERADEIHDEMRQEYEDEAYSEWNSENDPDDYEIEIVTENGLTYNEQKEYDKASAEYRSAARFFNDWLALQLPIPGIGHAVRQPKIADFVPPDLLAKMTAEPSYYWSITHPHRKDYESDDAYDTEDEAREAAEEKLAELKEEIEEEKDHFFENFEMPHEAWGEAMRRARADLGVSDDEDGQGSGTQFRKYAIPGGEEYGELLIRFPDLEGEYKSAHYKDQELVHMRFDTRHRSGGGEKTLFIHEIQSDLHQRSREFGFGKEGYAKAKEAESINGWTEEAAADFDRLTGEANTLSAEAATLRPDQKEEWDRYDGIMTKSVALREAAEKLAVKADARKKAATRYISTFGSSGAPEAPYTGNAWWELAFKRAVQYAVENGFDAISLTNPKQINAASYTPMHVAKQFYGESLPRFINKYLKQWGVKQENSKLSGAPYDVEYIRPDNVTREQLVEYFDRMAAHYRTVPNMTYFRERMETLATAIRSAPADFAPDRLLDMAEGEAPGRSALREGAPGIAPIYRSEGGTNPVWRITDEMRKQVNESGQPLALGPGSPSSDVALKRQISAFVKMGRSVTVPYADAVHEVIAPHLNSVPDDVFVAVLAKVAPIKNKKGRVTATFKTNSGAEYEMDGDLSDITNRRAFFRPGGLSGDGGIFLLRFNAPGSGDKLLIGEVRHESIHALRESGALSGPLWSRLLDHAKNLRVLDSDFKTYLQMIGSPNAKDAVDGVSILEMYEDAYDGYVSYDESIDQEYVAHLAELYSHGALLPQEVAPVKELLDDIFAGKYSKTSGEPRGESDSLQAFAGPWAKTASQNKLIQAQKLDAANAGPFTIWKRTGWYKAVDGRWKFEVDDSDARWFPAMIDKAMEMAGGARIALGKLLNHVALYKAYPELRDVSVYIDPKTPVGDGGFLAGNTKKAMGDDYEAKLPEKFFLIGSKPKRDDAWANKSDMRSAILHEIQHWIQEKEGFAGGSSPAFEAFNFEKRFRAGALTPDDEAVMRLPEVAAASKAMIAVAEQLAKQDNPSEDLLAAGQFFTKRYMDAIGYFLYERVSGEVEAREVQHRQFLSEEARSDIWPSPTHPDVQIVRPRASPYADDMLALAGRRAIGAPKEAMARAEAMEGRGRSPEAIWQATGTMRGIEGKQRWEIDDSGAKIIGLDKAFQTPKKSGFLARMLGRAPTPKPGIKEANNVPLLNVLHHPKLYNAYPFLRQMRVNLAYGDQAFKEGALRSRVRDKTRTYKPIEASGSTPEELLEVLMHEIQHYIQDREGFARGSDFVYEPPRKFAEKGNALYDPGQDLSEEERNDWRNLARNPTLLKMTRPESIAFRIIEAFERLDQAETEHDKRYAQQDIEELGKRLEDSMLVKGRDDYLASYGEAEARAVESRLGMNPQQRRAAFPGANLPEKLRDTSSQTRDYDQAYDTVMRRARVFKDIKARWAERKDLGSGVSVVRPDEEFLVYTHGQEDGLIEAKTYQSSADISVWPEFLEKPYAEQKKVMDVAMRDLRSRNMRPEVAYAGEISDEEFAFWARYNPRLVAFEPRLYRDRIEEIARELHGDDATVEFHDTGEVMVTSPEMQRNAEVAEEKRLKAELSFDDFSAKMIAKYGSIADLHQKGEPSEIARYGTLARQADDYIREDDKHYRYLDLTPIFADRAGYRRAPQGMDRDMWLEAMIDEQLAAMNKLPQPGDDIDFSDLVQRQ